MNVIGREAPREMSVRTRTSAMETQEEARQRRIAAREEREAARAEAARIAEEASYKRGARNRGTLVERVERASARIDKAPAGSVITILETLSPDEREVYLLAEERSPRGPQSQVLRFFPPPRKATREAFEKQLAEENDMPVGRNAALKGENAEEAEAEAAAEAEAERLQAEEAAKKPAPKKSAPRKRAAKSASK